MPMKTKQKTSAWAVWLVVLTLLLGLGIQISLGRRELRLSQRRAEEAMAELSVRLADTADDARRRQEERRAQAKASLLQGLEQRQEAFEAEERALLLLVNPWNPLPEDFVPDTEAITAEYWVDFRCAEPLRQMLDDCRAAGNYPLLCSAFRTREDQQKLFDNKVYRLRLEGLSREEAPEIAAMSVARPGTSEHELGLAVDIIDETYLKLDQGQERTGTQKWLMENCWRYGFILRYPNGTTEQTGVIYEPWHYRYVGEEHAKAITELGVTLEEYLALRRGG